MEFEVFREAVDVPQRMRGNGGGTKPSNPFTLAIIDWLNTDDKALKAKCKSQKEADRMYGLAYCYRKSHKLDFTIYKRGVEVYCIKA